VIQRHGAAPVDVLRLRGFDPDPAAIADETEFHLGHHAQDSQHHFAHTPSERRI
jgi:hypothetical protein